jgi:geranylgeranyl reductase family protein
MPTPDVIVAGAGPAGAWAAYQLARGGARVTIVDGSHPREKPCGGGVTGRALEKVVGAVREPPLRLLRPLFQPIARARLEYDGRAATVAVTPDGLAVASRAAFDRALLNAAIDAGAALVPSRVVDVAAGVDGARILTPRGTLRAGWIIGADGAAGVTRRKLWRRFRRNQISIATGFFARDVTSEEVVIRFTSDPPGYAWSFPRPDHLAIGVCAQADAANAAALREWTRQWMRSAGIAGNAPLEPYSWPIPSLGAGDFAAERAAGPGWMLVGDAAGLVDPITREGIFFAVQSGGAAARALLSDRGDPAGLYTASLRRDIYPELCNAARLARGFFEPRFTRLMIDAVNDSPAIAAVMADLVCGRQPYRGLRRRLIGTLELGLMLKLFSVRRTERVRLKPDSTDTLSHHVPIAGADPETRAPDLHRD